jgi:hypothetical protein
MARALRELRDIWADLTIEGLEAKDRRLSRSMISARERGEGLPSAKFIDAFVTACLRHRGWTPAAIIDELTHWTTVRNELDRRRREQSVVTTPSGIDGTRTTTVPVEGIEAAEEVAPEVSGDESTPDPTSDDATSPVAPANESLPVAILDQPVEEDHTDDDETPDPKATEAPRRWWRLSKGAYWGVGVAAAVVAVILTLVGLPTQHGPRTTAGAPSRSTLPPPQPLVTSPPYIPGVTYEQTVNSAEGARTYQDPRGPIGEGPRIENHLAVRVSCKVVAPGNRTIGIYWYRIASPRWYDSYYAPTNSFLNDDPISGRHDKVVDETVPYCPPIG